MDLSIKRRGHISIFLVTVLSLLIVVNLAFIWINSAKVSTESNESSKEIAEVIAEKTVKDYDKITDKEQKKHVAETNAKVRSLAHFTEFIPLGLLVFLLLLCIFEGCIYKGYLAFLIVASLGAGMLFGLLDEIHQIFVEGRAFEVKDILIDTLGASIGVVAGVILNLVFRKKA